MTQTVLLGDIAAVVDSRHQTPKYSSGGYPMVRVKDLDGGILDTSKCLRVSEDVYKHFSKGYTPKKGDLVFSRVGSEGIPSLVSEDEEFCLGQNTAFILPNDRNNYLYYWLLSPQGKNEIAKATTGSTQKTISLKSINELKINLPSTYEQKKIADILGTIDEKIELNRKMNETLEQMGKALFHHYFITNPEVENWHNTIIGKCYEVLLGGTPSRNKAEYWKNGTVGWINSGKINQFRITSPSELITQEALDKSAAKLLPTETTVIAITGATLGQYSRLEKSFSANQSVIGIVPTGNLSNEFAYYWIALNIERLIVHQTGGAQQHINRNNVFNFDIPLPPSNILDKFQNFIEPLMKQISINCFEDESLISLRDSLLPRLISGKIKV